MEAILAALIGLIAAVALYRFLRQRNATAQQRVGTMLRQVDGLAKDGVAEREALLRLLLARPGWRELPADFLGELIGRLENKVAVLRFVVLSEDCGYTKDKLPAIPIARRPMGDRSMWPVCWPVSDTSCNRSAASRKPSLSRDWLFL